MNCPACGGPVPADEISAGLAHCPSCDNVWELAAVPQRTALPEPPPPLAAPLPAPPVLPRPDVDLAYPPDRVYVHQHRGGVTEMVLPWSNEVGPLIHALWLLIPLPLLGGISLGGLMMSGTLGLCWAYYVFEKTKVLVSRKGVIVSHEPIPALLSWSGRLDTNDLSGLRIQSRTDGLVGMTNFDTERLSHHGLKAGDTTLLAGWKDEPSIEFVYDAIRQITGADVSQPLHEQVPGLPALPVPEGMDVQVVGDIIELKLPWNAHSTPMGVHVLGLLSMPFLFLGGLAGMLIGLPLLAFWLYLGNNTTKVTIRPRGVDLVNGPLPNPLTPDLHLDARDLDALSLAESWVPGRSRTVYYELRTGRRTLTAYWADPSKLEYIQQCIELTLARSRP